MVKRIAFDFNLFRAMEVFTAIVETGQVTKAAELLGITQSAASQHLRILEESLGTRLLDRSSRPVKLTQAGISLHYRSQKVMSEVEELAADIYRLKPARIPVLRIGMLASIATTLTSRLVDVGRKRFGISEITMHAGISSDHQNLLRSRRADLVVTSDALYDVDGLERHPILRESFLLVTPKDYKGPVDDLAALSRKLPLVRFSSDVPVGRRTDQHLRRVRLDLPRVFEADRSSMVTAAVAAGQGFAILSPTLLIDGYTERMPLSVHKLPIPGFTRTITLVARDMELDRLPAIFAQEIGKVLTHAIDQLFETLPDGSVALISDQGEITKAKN